MRWTQGPVYAGDDNNDIEDRLPQRVAFVVAAHREMTRRRFVPPPPSPPFPPPRQTRACCLSLSLSLARSGEYTQGPGPRRSASRSRTRAWGSRRTFAWRTSSTATQSVRPPAMMRLCWGPSSSTLQGRGPDSPRQGARHSPGLRHQHRSGCRALVAAATVAPPRDNDVGTIANLVVWRWRQPGPQLTRPRLPSLRRQLSIGAGPDTGSASACACVLSGHGQLQTSGCLAAALVHVVPSVEGEGGATARTTRRPTHVASRG